MVQQGSYIPISSVSATWPVEKASFMRRFLAYIIDLGVLGLAGACLDFAVAPTPPPAVWRAITAAIAAIYFIWSYSISGQTLGKRVLQIKVISIDGSPLNWRKGLLRSAGYMASAFPLGLGFLWSIWDADKQAWHDKVAGTCVVPASVAREQLLGAADPAQVRRRQRQWLLRLGILALLVLVGYLALAQTGVAEVREMGPWPGPEVPPGELVTMDLSHLGLEAGQVQSARDQVTWADGRYEDGALVVYKAGAESVVAVWALRYATKQAAGNDYSSLQAWVEGNCRLSSRIYIGNAGVIHCQFSNGYDKTFWNGQWIVDIMALEGAEATPDVLVDQVRDAVAAHWRTMAQSSH
jgi:uncharacterized RDD family membrane protein YckC